jgi:hypothetical protein
MINPHGALWSGRLRKLSKSQHMLGKQQQGISEREHRRARIERS